MDDGWKNWDGKKVFIILKNKRNYQGIIKRVDIEKFLIWITITDKFGKLITFSHDEIEVMEEEE